MHDIPRFITCIVHDLIVFQPQAEMIPRSFSRHIKSVGKSWGACPNSSVKKAPVGGSSVGYIPSDSSGISRVNPLK